MRNFLMKSLVLCAVAFSTAAAHADQLVTPAALKSTERGMFMSNGRYFVAGKDGIHEVKRTVDNSPNCKLDSTGYTVCKLVSTAYGSDTCNFSGMTTDHTYLYASCTVAGAGGLLENLVPPKRAALFRIKPGAGATAEVKIKPFATPVWYNGMAMLDDRSILMTPSAPLGTKPAVVKLKISNTSTLDHTITQWLPGSALYLLPNGIQISNDYLYFVGGQSLFRIQIKSDGSAGIPVLLYQTAVNQVLDDLTIRGDWVAVCNHAIVNGLGVDTITLVHKTGLGPTYLAWTGLTQISSLAVDPGTFGTPGAFIGTSFFQGGIYRYFY